MLEELNCVELDIHSKIWESAYKSSDESGLTVSLKETMDYMTSPE